MGKKVENKKEVNEANKFLLVVLSLLFCFTLYITLRYIDRYYENKMPKANEEIVEIKTEDLSATITNNGHIEKIIDRSSFDEKREIVLENINKIEIISNNEEEHNFKFNVRYNILKNEFKINDIPSNKSEVLVKFSYSYDLEEWKYLNNVISTEASNIAPLIGNNYDIAGLINKLNVVTDYEVTVNDKEPVIMYFRSETIFKDLDNNENAKQFNANFIIEQEKDK